MVLSMFSKKNEIKEVSKPREYDMENIWDFIDFGLKEKAEDLAEALSHFFDKHPDQINAVNSSQQTPLLRLMCSGMEYKIRENSLDILDVLISRGANLDAVDNYNKTSLMHLINNKNYKEASLLLKNGANDQLESKDGYKVDRYVQDEKGYECLMRGRSGRLTVISDEVVEVTDFTANIKEQLRTVFNVAAETVTEMYGQREYWNSSRDKWKILRTDRFSEFGEDYPPRLIQAIALIKQRQQEQPNTTIALNNNKKKNCIIS